MRYVIPMILLACCMGEARADWVQRCNGGRCELVWVDYGQAGRVLTPDASPPVVGSTMILSFAPAEAQRMPVGNGPTVVRVATCCETARFAPVQRFRERRAERRACR